MAVSHISFGPALAENGSWSWIGIDLANNLSSSFKVTSWKDNPPDCDVVVFVKFPPSPRGLLQIAPSTKIVYFPIDFFQSVEHIAALGDFLRRCDQIIISSWRQKQFFEQFAPVEYLDHHVKYVVPRFKQPNPDDPILWVGVHTNLSPLVEWVNEHGIPKDLLILTNFDKDQFPVISQSVGFKEPHRICIKEWSVERHIAALSRSSGAIDIKGNDFAAFCKPSTKAIDFICSGLPLAMNLDSSPFEHLDNLGLAVPDPRDTDRWFSSEYYNETVRVGAVLREAFSLERVATNFRQILWNTLNQSDPGSFREGRSSAYRNPIIDSVSSDSVEGDLKRNGIRSYRMEKYGDGTETGRNNAVNGSIHGDNHPRGTFDDSLTHSAELTWGQRDNHSLPESDSPTRIAIVSFLFNWPSTGGGIVHTMELASFLARDGYEVMHFYACNPDWSVGNVAAPLPYPAMPLRFSGNHANLDEILESFRRALGEYGADYVIITDSWNIKPLLAEAASEFPYLLRFQALECLCPLNNVRFLPEGNGNFKQCGKHQLATPHDCHQCVRQKGQYSGSLHQFERSLAGVGTQEYDGLLRRAVRDAHAVLVVNPEMATMFSPYSDRVHVVPSGFDPARFPWQVEEHSCPSGRPRKLKLFFAGLVEEWIKGFPYLHEACARLWQKRKDFELLVTADPVGQQNEFMRFIGWQSQSDLPAQLFSSDIVLVPTVAQEALGRTAVEAMGAGKPVIASRLGGLKSTVIDGYTGLLAEPGNPIDLAEKIERLLDDPQLRLRLGIAGRKRFEHEFTWESIIERHYRVLLPKRPLQTSASNSSGSKIRTLMGIGS